MQRIAEGNVDTGMRYFWERNKRELFLLGLFFWAEYERVINDNPFGRSADNLIFCVIAIVWALFLKRRIVDDRTRNLLIGIAGNIMLLFLLRTFKYSIMEKNTILWYLYYLPLTTMPYLSFLMAKGISGTQNAKKRPTEKWWFVGLVLINAMVVTNDLHQLVFRFHDPKDIDTYDYRIGYIVTIVWIGAFVLASFYHLYKACSLPQSKGRMWVPLIPTITGIFLMGISAFGGVPIVNNTRLFLFHEITMLMVIAIVEACIRIGVIPSNDGYEEIFKKSSINACITDRSNHAVYSSDNRSLITEEKRTEAKRDKVMLDDHTRLHSSKINGGWLYYTEDIRGIIRLNQMLEEAMEIISDETAVIEAENRLLADEAMIKTKNKLYDDIAWIVRPQVAAIEECLKQCESDPDNDAVYIAKAAVLNAYIKRRVNLSLLAMENDRISVTELYLAIAESLNYLRYCSVLTNIASRVQERTVEVDCCIRVYDYFENVLEQFYGRMTAVMITIDEKKEKTMIRIMVETEEGKDKLPKYTCEHEICEEDGAIVVTVMLG